MEKLILPVIIDNITTKLNPNIYIENLKNTFNNIEFNTKLLKKGGIVVTPTQQHHISTFLNTDKYNPDIFGNKLDIHVVGADRDLRPWLCINKIDINTSLDTIQHNIEALDNNIKIQALHRKNKGPYETTLILFKTTDNNTDKLILNKHLTINNNKCHIRLYINAGQTRCTQCNKIGHIKNKCSYTQTCVMCAGSDCPVGKCKNSFRKCVNCTLDHPSSFPNCPALKAHLKDKFNIKRQNNVEHNQINQHINTSTQIDNLTNRINILEQLIKKQAHESKTLLDTQININTENCSLINTQKTHIEELQNKLNSQTQLNIDINNKIDNNTKEINANAKEIDTATEYMTNNFHDNQKEVNAHLDAEVKHINETLEIYIIPKIKQLHKLTKHIDYDTSDENETKNKKTKTVASRNLRSNRK